jgi:TonB family protein
VPTVKACLLSLALWLVGAAPAQAGEPVMLAPSVGTGQRMSDITKPPHAPTLPRELQRPGATYWGLYKACLSAAGKVSRVEVIHSSDNPSLDQRWMRTVRGWRHRPYRVAGRGVAFCYPMRLEVRVLPVVPSSEPVMIAPNVGTGQRMSDTTQAPYRPTLPSELQGPGSTYWGLYKVCVSTKGETAGVEIMRSTGHAALDERWIAAIRQWRYQPYRVRDQAVPFCYPTRIEIRT